MKYIIAYIMDKDWRVDFAYQDFQRDALCQRLRELGLPYYVGELERHCRQAKSRPPREGEIPLKMDTMRAEKSCTVKMRRYMSGLA